MNSLHDIFDTYHPNVLNMCQPVTWVTKLQSLYVLVNWTSNMYQLVTSNMELATSTVESVLWSNLKQRDKWSNDTEMKAAVLLKQNCYNIKKNY